jgi:hypothetical protein
VCFRCLGQAVIFNGCFFVPVHVGIGVLCAVVAEEIAREVRGQVERDGIPTSTVEDTHVKGPQEMGLHHGPFATGGRR